MPETIGHLRFASASGRLPWSILTANGPALVANTADPLATLAELDRRSQTTRYAGYLSYDLGRHFETLPAVAPDALGLPPLAFVAVDQPSANLSGLAHLDDQASHLLRSTFAQPAYEAAVKRCLNYIAAGDVFQINLSQRLEVRTDRTPSQLFLDLNTKFPAEYAALIEFDRFSIVSNSPELFLRVTKLPDGRRKIVNRPIKGTRPNAPGMADELLHSEKDKAELAMIVDLQRNDLGRICEIGSVVVTEPRVIETHPTVLHGVATVEGVLRDGVSLTDILRATFPCGSVTGCPKIRAMEIIEELEPVRRGAYCGAIGWIGGGEMELSVAIRTMTILDGIAYVPVGGGIVADSEPAEEYAETMVKAKAMLAALGVQQKAMTHEALMREALELAKTAMRLGEVPIAAVVALDGQIIGWGWNELNAKRDRTMHAEIAAFRDAAGRYPLATSNLTLVSTLEPCVMCFGAALLSGVAEIVYALPAPADGGARRVNKPESPAVQWPRIVGSVMAAESHELFEQWLRDHPKDGPQRDFVSQLLSALDPDGT